VPMLALLALFSVVIRDNLIPIRKRVKYECACNGIDTRHSTTRGHSTLDYRAPNSTLDYRGARVRLDSTESPAWRPTRGRRDVRPGTPRDTPRGYLPRPGRNAAEKSCTGFQARDLRVWPATNPKKGGEGMCTAVSVVMGWFEVWVSVC
jgi:hypothetical protein